MIGGNNLRKFLKSEIDLIYNLLQPDEEVLWRGKPKVMPALTYLSTLLFILIISIIFIILRLIKLKELQADYWDWYLIALVIFAVVVIFYTIVYIIRYNKKIKDIFYVVTSKRLTIFNSKSERIIMTKLYPTVKILRYKQSLFDPGSIIFDFDIIDFRIVEKGFNNIDEAKKVYTIINKQLTHLKEQELDEA